MSFLNPLVLLGLAAAAIPLVVHLFNFRRPQKVDFSSLSFLKELEKSTMQRVRIKQWLLLLLRTLAIACLVLAFARPTLRGDVAGVLGGQAPSSIALVLDNSLSMTLRDAQGEYMEQARALAGGIIDETRPGDEVFVLTTAGMHRQDAFTNRSAALEAVGSVEAQPGAAATARTLRRSATLLEEEGIHVNKEIYLFSDLQQSTLADSLQGTPPGETPAVLIPVGDRAHANVAVTDVQVTSRIIEAGQPVQLEATLVNYGSEPLENYTASVYLGEERVAQASTNLPPDRPTEVNFTATPQRRGWLGGRVEIEEDAFPADNVRYFTLNVPRQRHILVVRGRGQEIKYLNLALSPDLTEGSIAFSQRVIPENELAATALGQYDVVALVGPATLSSGEVASITRYVQDGGGLLFFPSSDAQPQDYNALLTGLNAGQFGGFSGSQGSEQSIASFDRVDVEHPLFEGVFDQTSDQVESPSLYYAMNYTPTAGTEQTLIELSNGFPFLQEIRYGQGAALLLAVAPDPSWSDLPVRGLFIPLLYRAVYYLSAGHSSMGQQLTIGEPGEVRLTGVSDTERLHLVGPEGATFTPEQRNLFGAVLLQLDAAMRPPGTYDVMAGDTLVQRVAYNLDAHESDLDALPADEAASRLAEATGLSTRVMNVSGDDPQRLAQALQEQRMGVELWNVFLLLALLFLIAEMVVAKRWKPEAVPT